MGAQQSKVRISIPSKTCCFPSYNNESEIFETVQQIEDCHLQAVQLASWIGSMIASPYSPVGHVAFSAATILFTFMLYRVAKKSSKGDPEEDKLNNNSSKCNQTQKKADTTLEDALIDSKVSAAIAKKSVCELQAKLCVINNRYQRLLSEISVEDRRLEVVPAIQTCEEVLQLFHDPTHVFRLNPLVSSPFLVTFSGIFVAIAELSMVLIPSYKGPLVGEMSLLSETLSLYKKACIKTRMDNLKFRRLQPGSMLDVVAGGMSEMNYRMEDACLMGTEYYHDAQEENSTRGSTVDEDEIDEVYHDANDAVTAYRNGLEDEYSRFFETALETISKFSGFRSSTCTIGCSMQQGK